ncbi:MAG: cisplatin damage response ATP-dependent DNA ligase [Rhodospirillum sp.]|nr:cisplatin damage response ATP-dependent DNA ligase [Rhodospirillum sp.]MCF8501218.1 cisplatin damage response ATP-dependent DNA ligase [Rhodospirillum sp.]
MKAFAALVDRLSTTPGREAKLILIGAYLDRAPDPDRGWGLAVLAGDLDIPRLKAAAAKALILDRVDRELFALSHAYVGDLAETVALLWPKPPVLPKPPTLSDVVEAARLLPREELMDRLTGWLDGLDATGRWALLKLLTGGIRVGASARLARAAFARWAALEGAAVEAVWFSRKPPYPALFTWASGGEAPDVENQIALRPFMLASPLEDLERARLDLAEYAVDWTGDGIRAQLVSSGGDTRIFSREGEDITRGFPDLVAALDFEGTLDGDLRLLTPEGTPAPFAALEKRLTRETVSKAMLATLPAHARLHDVLFDGGEDLRPLPFRVRRARLEAWHGASPRPHLDLSPLVDVADWETLDRLRAEGGTDGLRLKRWESPYVGGPTGDWILAKRPPLSINCLLMYAQRPARGGARPPTEVTVGVWKGADLVPLGKTIPDLTEDEGKRLTQWILDHGRERFGPVRAVDPELVMEITFESVQASPRHRAGLSLRLPRIRQIHWDMPAKNADRLETLIGLM